MNPLTAGTRRVLDSLRPLLVFAAILLAGLMLFRLCFIGWQWQRVTAVDMFWPLVVQGLRFDLVLTGIACALPVLLFPLLASTPRTQVLWRGFLTLYLPAVLLGALVLELATPSFIEQFDARPNRLFFEYLDHPREIAATLWAAYRAPLLVAATLLAAAGAALYRFFPALPRRTRACGIPAALLATPVLLFICFAMIRSTTDHRPVNPSTVAVSTDPMVNDLALSSGYTLLYALYETRHEDTGGVRYAEVPPAEAIEEVRAAMGLPGDAFRDADIPTAHFQLAVADEHKNLVIIVEESLGAEFVGSLGGRNLTPNLDALAQQGMWFENLYATGTRSVRGLEAVVTGFTPTPAPSVVKLPGAQRNFFTLAALLAREGYDTSFIYGGEAQFDNMRRFFMNNGFAEVIDEKDYADPVFTGSWGASDEDLFNKAHEAFSAARDRPFFSLVFTSSNHSPFEFPDGRIAQVDADKNTVNNAVKYADFALGRFFDTARQSAYWQDTVFLVVADHNSRVYGNELVPVDRFHIPGLILGESIPPSVFTRVASQIDLAPTLLSLIGVSAAHPMIGHDLTDPVLAGGPGRAIMQFNGTQAYMEGDRVLVMQKDLPPVQFLYADGHLQQAGGVDPRLARKALAHAAWSSIAYAQGLYRLPPDDPASRIAAHAGEQDALHKHRL